jgi:hypothetical protein
MLRGSKTPLNPLSAEPRRLLLASVEIGEGWAAEHRRVPRQLGEGLEQERRQAGPKDASWPT